MERSDTLDGMRGLAVLIVFLSHTSSRDMALAPWLQFHGIGHVGVYLFFVLSGFLLTRNLLNGQRPGTYLVRRFFRIAPLYFIVLAGVLAWQAAGNYSPRYLHISGGAEGALLHSLFLKGDSVFWTITAEFGFYLLLPIIVAGMVRFGRVWVAVAAVAYFAWFYAIQAFGASLPPLKFVDIAHRGQFLDVFACGILAATVTQRLPEKVTAAAFWGLLALTLAAVSYNFLGLGRPWYDLRYLSLLYGAVFAAGIVGVVQGNMLIVAPMKWSWLRFMGITGFGWYLLHFPVFQAVNATMEGQPAQIRLVVSTALVALAAWAAFRLIEKPANEFGRALTMPSVRAAH
ncbi:acyltransferase family protein [Nitratidesulfovibrio sp. 1201_IL3209]|uniref:acyltransferase family protein n=1 Tax=Nitratidesulfovibrio sp. 1201_IL3209 TaxID=3084053 RepID=UPI002FD98B61